MQNLADEDEKFLLKQMGKVAHLMAYEKEHGEIPLTRDTKPTAKVPTDGIGR